MQNMNLVLLVGRLTKDPVIHEVGEQKVKKVVCSMATNRPYKLQNGEWAEETVFHNLEAWASGAETFATNLKKGNLIFVEGSNKTDSWDDNDGNRKYKSYVRINHFYKVVSIPNSNSNSSNNEEPVGAISSGDGTDISF